jgi:hypothetical protein
VRAISGLAFAGRLLLGGALLAAGVASAGGVPAEPEKPARQEWPHRSAPTTTDEKVTIGDIEDRFRSLEGAATEVISERTSGPNFVLIAVGGSVLLLALVYLLGRRRGRRRGSVLEIRRLV